MRGKRGAVVVALGLAVAWPLTALGASGPNGGRFTLSTQAMAVTNLAFSGLVTLGTTTVLEFTADSVSLSGFTEKQPCSGGFQAVQSIPNTATATLAGPVTLLADSLAYTPPAGPTITFSVTNLPAVGTLVAAGTLPSVALTGASLVAASMTATTLSMTVAAC